MISFITILFLILAFPIEMPDFGPEGLGGLTPEQKQELDRGEIVLPQSLSKTPEGKPLVEAALVFEKSPEDVWRLLSPIEDQIKYLKEVRKITVLSEEPTRNHVEFTVRKMKTVVYRVIHEYDQQNCYFYWNLDPEFESYIKELSGYWRFYPYKNGKTLARYGSIVSPKISIPGFIKNLLYKSGVRSSLQAVKRYVDTGGRWCVVRKGSEDEKN